MPCPGCHGRSVTSTNNLLVKYPQIKRVWHPDNEKRPEEYTSKTNVKAKFKCPECDHEWTTTINSVTRSWDNGYSGCQNCAGQAVTSTNNLLVKYPQIKQVWHIDNENGPEEYASGTPQKAKFKCPDCDHEWTARIYSIVKSLNNGYTGCPGCAGRCVSFVNNLLVKCPQIERVWHPDNKKGPKEYTSGTHQKVKFKCPDCNCKWTASIYSIVKSLNNGHNGCIVCRMGWTKDKVDDFFNVLDKNSNLLSEEIRYHICQMFGNNLHAKLRASQSQLSGIKSQLEGDDDDLDFKAPSELAVSVAQIMKGIDKPVLNGIPQETLEYLLELLVWDIWGQAFENEHKTVKDIKKHKPKTDRSQIVKQKFIDEYKRAKELPLPKLNFFIKGKKKKCDPILMQRLVALRVKDRPTANFSETGCGKTGSAFCAVRSTDASVVVGIVPNDIKRAWIRGIELNFGDEAAVHESFVSKSVDGKINFYIINYEKFQQNNSQGHTWCVPSDYIQQGSWCPFCAGKHKTIKDMQALAAARSGKCLSAKYINGQTKLEWECGNKHKWRTTPSLIIQGHWCPICSSSRTSKHDYSKAPQLYLEGKSSCEIAEKLHIPVSGVLRELHKNGISVNNRRKERHLDPRITELYNSGSSQADISRMLGYNRATVSRGIKINSS